MQDIQGVLREILQVILSYKDASEIRLFGSRARADHGRASDIDLAIIDARWSRQDINLARDRVEESVRTPLKIDLLGYHLVQKESLKRKILEEGVLVHGRENR